MLSQVTGLGILSSGGHIFTYILSLGAKLIMLILAATCFKGAVSWSRLNFLKGLADATDLIGLRACPLYHILLV